MKKIFVVILTIISLFMSCVFSYAQRISTELENSIFRIHIIANSNSNYDQEIKLKVRDAVVSFFESKDLNFSCMDDAIMYFQNNIECVNNIVSKSLKENNVQYSFYSNISKEYFPSKEYTNISLPSGKYNCIKVVLGSGNGANWWCMLYPNLCLNDLSISNSSNNILKNGLSDDAYLTIANEKKYTFKIVEIYENMKNKLQ